MYIIISGDPINGFKFFGSFETKDEAIDWAQFEPLEEWYVAYLHKAEENKEKY